MVKLTFCSYILFYNATTENKCEINRVHYYSLYIATVSIMHKAVDRIKTALRFWLNAVSCCQNKQDGGMRFSSLGSKRGWFCWISSIIVAL